MPKWSYILNSKKDPSTTITRQTRGKGGNKGGGWNGRKNKGRREIQLLVPLPRPLFTLIDLLRVGESTCIASHLPSRIWGHIGNRTRDFSQRRPGTKQVPKILASWLFQSLGKKFFNQLKKDGRKRRRRRRFPFSSVSLTSFLTLAEVVSLHTRANIRENFCEKRAGQGGGGLSFFSCHCSFPATDHTSLSLASPCFRDVSTICESETDNETTGTQARLTLESKAFFTFAPVIHSLLGWWQTNDASPGSDLVGRTCLLKMKN